jgi:hypothetical protein
MLWVAGLIKESFVPILPGVLASIYLVVPAIAPSVIPRRARLRLVDGLILFALIVGVSAQVGLILTVLQTYGHQHTAQISVVTVLTTLRRMLELYSVSTLWFLPVFAGLVALLPLSNQEWHSRAWREELTKAIAVLVAASVLFLAPQLVVYAGSPHAGRYLTPGNLFVMLTTVLGFHLLSRNVFRRPYTELQGVVAGMLIAVALFRILGSHRDATEQAVAARKFESQLAEIVELKTRHPELPLLFFSTAVSDREPIVSFARYLAIRLPVPERPFLMPFGWETDANSPGDLRLAQLLREQSLEGDELFDKIGHIRGNDRDCIAVVFSESFDKPRCTYVVHASS